MTHGEIVDWLMAGDPAIAYQTARDLLDQDRPDLRARIATEGWGKAYLEARNKRGGWGTRYYGARWANSHYTLLDLANMAFPPDHPQIQALVADIATRHVAADCGLGERPGERKSDTCVTGMFLNFASHFRTPKSLLETYVDFLLGVQLPDGGFNCRINRAKCSHSSLHSTLSVLEGFHRYETAGNDYRISDVRRAAKEARAFVLLHRFYRSDRTGNVIHSDFLKFPYPPRWYYNILRGLDHFRAAGVPESPAMNDALDRVVERRRKDGRWPIMAKKSGKVFFDMESGNGPGRWNTLLALRVLKAYPHA